MSLEYVILTQERALSEFKLNRCQNYSFFFLICPNATGPPVNDFQFLTMLTFPILSLQCLILKHLMTHDSPLSEFELIWWIFGQKQSSRLMIFSVFNHIPISHSHTLLNTLYYRHLPKAATRALRHLAKDNQTVPVRL